MKTLKTIFIASFMMAAVGVSAQNVDEIVQKHIAARIRIKWTECLQEKKSKGRK